MANNLIKFCTAALAGSLIGIAYERLPPTKEWLKTVSATSSIVPKKPTDELGSPRFDVTAINPKTSGENLKHSSRYGLPSKDNIRIFNDFIMSYDRRLRAPVWVIEHLTPEKLRHHENGVDRDHSSFREDLTLHEYFRAKNADFSGSGYDRGHLAPAGNHKLDQEDMNQTFILSNISPQVPKFNRGGWERLETYVRWRAKRANNLYVVTGPLYLPMRARDGNLYVTYRVIGNNHVSVPTHYFKVFVVETKDNKLEMEAFLMPNDPTVDDHVKLDDYRVPIERLDIIERASGVIFFDQLARNKLEAPRSLPEGFKDGPRGRQQ